ncbi:acyltransferase [Candidatus Woesearchaeota archaeon]|nr:acyltransferase [Candidatus Woesearchaeota archaeon]
MKKLYYDNIAIKHTKLKKEVNKKRGLKYHTLQFLANLTRSTSLLYGYLIRRIIYKLALKKCGSGLIIHPYSVIKFPQKIEIGDYCSINQFCFINGLQGIKIGDNVSISAGSNIVSQTVQNERMEALGFGKVKPNRFKPIEIGDNSWVACGCLIGPGVKIGKNCQIGANSVVLDNIPDRCFAAGTPAKIIKKIR